MKLRIVATIAVLVGSVLTTAGLGAASAARATAATAGAMAATAGGGLAKTSSEPLVTIRAIDREGRLVAVTASLQSPEICPTCLDVTLTSRHPTRVPKGTYNIAAWIQEPNGSAQTLVSRELVVTRSQTVTFDARKGRPIRFTVNDRTVTQDALEAEPFSSVGWDAFDGYGPVMGEAVYAVPGTMAPNYHLYLQADLIRPEPGEKASPVEYILIRLLGRSIPANLTFASNTARLARDRVTAREIDSGTTDGVWLQPVPSNGALQYPSTLMGQTAQTPFSETFEVTPGYQWQSQTQSGTMNLNNLPVLRVHSYGQTFDSAVYGPSPEFGPMVVGNDLEPSVLPWGQYLLDDPTQELDSSFGMQPGSTQAWLYAGRRLLAQARNGGFTVKIPAPARWYTMKVRVNRGAGSRLFVSELLSFNFRAWAQDDGLASNVFWPRFIPSGLNWLNAARPGSRTTVPIWFTSLSGNIAAHNVRVWASYNNGKQWTALRVSRHGLRWSVVVPNPRQAGYVSLRALGTDAAGSTATVTVIRAYAVS